LALLKLVDVGTVLDKEETRLLERKILGTDLNPDFEETKISAIIDRLLDDVKESKFNYPNHLGIDGLYRLHKAMCACRNREERNNVSPLLIIGEYPEELGSYRQVVARILNNMGYNEIVNPVQRGQNEYPKRKVRCLTGDIGLHIGIGVNKTKEEEQEQRMDLADSLLMVRCHRCNQNSEIVARNWHYHLVEAIQETIVKRTDNSIVYLCSTYGHAMLPLSKPDAFLGQIP
jgi:hypothetical protein